MSVGFHAKRPRDVSQVSYFETVLFTVLWRGGIGKSQKVLPHARIGT